MSYNNYPGDFNQGGYNSGPPGGFNQGGYNSGPPSNFGGSSESFDEIDFDSINPNAEPWEIAKNLTGGERDLSFSSNDLQNAFNKAQHMNVDIDTNRSRDMFDQANVTARGGGGTSMTTKLIAGAAGFAAMNYYQNYQKKQGKTVHYAFLKKMVAGVAMAQAVKMFNKNTQGGSGFMGMGGKRDIEASREAVAAEAAANAMKLVDEQYGDQQGGYGGNQQGGYGGNQQGGYGGNQQGGYGGNQYGSGPNVPQGPGSYNPPNQGGGYGGNQGGYGQPPSYSSGPQGGSFGGDYKDPQGGYGGNQGGYGGNQGGYGGNQGGYGGNQGNQGGYGGNQGYPPQPGFPGQGNPPSNNPPGPGGFIDPSQRRY